MSEFQFAALQKELFLQFQEGHIDDIHPLLLKIQKEFPDKIDKTSFWKACLYAAQDKPLIAVSILQEALEKGWWWNPHTLANDPDLISLHHLKEFKAVLKTCEYRLAKESMTTHPKLFVYGNQMADTGIFPIHWKASNVKEFSSYWLNANTEKQYLFGFPQSSQVYACHSFCWDLYEIAKQEITNSFCNFRKKYSPHQMILAGASQGGLLALELCLNGNPLDVQGFIAVIPAIKDISSLKNLLKTNKIPNIKGCLITGDKDPYFHNAVDLKTELEFYGISCKFVVKEGLGHYFPDDFPALLSESVNFILESN